MLTVGEEEMEAMGAVGKQKSGPRVGRRIVTVVSLILCVLLGILLVCNLTIIIKGTLNPRKPPSVLGVTPLVVLSGSMSGSREGHIEVGDLVLVSRVDPGELETGDVIAYMSGETTVTHRITGIETNGEERLFTTKGDANNAADTEAVTEEQLVGVCRGRIPKVGDFALFLRQPLGMLLFAGVPLLAFIVYDILRRQSYARRQRVRTRELEEELARLRELKPEKEEEAGK